jgi:acetyltransferase
MKTISLPQKPATKLPDFGGRPGRIHLEHIFAVRGYGKLKIRPIRLDDEEAMDRFHTGLSEESIYLRYFEYLGLDLRTDRKRLDRVCANSPESYAVVIEQPARPHRAAAILAVGRLTKARKPYTCTFDTLITDGEGQGKLRKVLLRHLIKLARAFGFKTVAGDLLVADREAVNLCRDLGFDVETLPQDGVVKARLNL